MKFQEWQDSDVDYGCAVVENPIHQISPDESIAAGVEEYSTEIDGELIEWTDPVINSDTCLGENDELSRLDSLWYGWGWDRVTEEDGRYYWNCCSGLSDITDIIYDPEVEHKEGASPKETLKNDPTWILRYEYGFGLQEPSEYDVKEWSKVIDEVKVRREEWLNSDDITTEVA